MDTLSGMNTDLMKAAKEDKEKARAEKTAEKKKAEKQADEKRANKKEQEKASDSENEEHIKDREPDNELSNAGFVNIIADSLTPSTGTRDPIGTKVDVNA
jgi:folate-dependent phosphoribosylglycinamide formyltransferase PurN